jgi:hypothetical protein
MMMVIIIIITLMSKTMRWWVVKGGNKNTCRRFVRISEGIFIMPWGSTVSECSSEIYFARFGLDLTSSGKCPVEGSCENASRSLGFM